MKWINVPLSKILLLSNDTNMPVWKQRMIYCVSILWTYTKKGWKYFMGDFIEQSPFTGRWMSKREEHRYINSHPHTGFIVDGHRKLSLDTSFSHCLLSGVTGSGKSSCFYIPQLLTLKHSSVVLDCSGQIFAKTSGVIARKGFCVKQINLSSPLQSELYNPLLRATTNSKLKKLSRTLVDLAFTQGKDSDSFWGISGGNLLYCIMKTVKGLENEQMHTLANVRHILNNLTANSKSSGFLWMMENADTRTYDEFKGIMSGGDKVVNSILAMCRSTLGKLADEELEFLTSGDTIGDIHALLRKRKSVLYITVKESDIPYLRYMISIILSDIFDMCMTMPEEGDEPILLLLDEFAHFKIDGCSTYLTTLRKRQVACMLSVQSKSMLAQHYSTAEAHAIANGGCATHILITGQKDRRENEDVAALLGSSLIEFQGRKVAKPLMTPDEIFSSKGQAIVLQSGHRPLKVHLRPYYKNTRLLKQTKTESYLTRKWSLQSPPLIDLRGECTSEL